MESGSSQEPPVKKRRFFKSPEASSDGVNGQSSPLEPRRFFKAEDDVDSPQTQQKRFFKDDETDSPPQSQKREIEADDVDSLLPQPKREIEADDKTDSPLPPSQSIRDESSQVTFDKATFESVVGAKVDADVLRTIQHHCGNNLERAVNMYFDGTYRKLQKPRSPAKLSSPAPRKVGSNQPTLPVRRSMQARYIGAFGVEGWATRSGTNLLKHGDAVHIERQKIQPPLRTRGKPGSHVGSRRVDVLVRFTNRGGQEIGRLAKDTANWVSTLIDQRVVQFEGTCVYCPERVRTNDTVFLQLRCSLLDSAFFGRSLTLTPDHRASPFEQAETDEEKALRLRQAALVRLFHEINLQPRVVNSAAKDGRKGLLKAAEMDEEKQKEANKGPATPASTNAASGPADEDSPASDEAEEGQELEQDQLDTLYRKAQTFDLSTPEAEPAETFALQLRPYQKQSLHWMMAKEKREEGGGRAASMHPLWEEYEWPTKDVDGEDVPRVDGQSQFYVNPYSGELSLDFPAQEQACLGGILADEMGLGKTIQMLSLIHTHKSEAAKESSGMTMLHRLPKKSSKVEAPTTLVVAPMSLLSQWQSETIKASKAGSLRTELYYGGDKTTSLQALCSGPLAPDVVITSYGIVLSEFSGRRGDGSSTHQGLFSLRFFRVILDEAHLIKNRTSKTARACCELSAQHRWVLTGTPIVNRLEDLFSLVRFLGVAPWNNFSFWKTFITVPFESGEFVRALDVVQTVLEPLVMRRTKEMRTADGQPLVPLPAKRIEIVEVELSQTERAVYDYIFTRAKRTLSRNVEAGTVLKAFTTIFAQILRLRQSCCHPVLIRNKELVADEEVAGAAADAAAGLADDMDLETLIAQFTADTDDGRLVYGAHALEEIRKSAEKECPLCFDEPMKELVVTGCWHSACKSCLVGFMKHESDHHRVARCFNCRAPLNQRDLFEIVRHDDDDTPGEDGVHKGEGKGGKETGGISLQRLGVNASSSKVAALMSQLRELRRDHPRMKSVVFSQFTSFLTLIEAALGRVKMRFLRLDGTMHQRARAAVLREFSEAEGFVVLLLSLRAGGVGLNLTSAGRVYMMDPWWSFAVEAQAIDRVHRLGQEGEVVVKRFIVRESVEERMLKVQERKKFIASSLGMMSDEEKKMQRIEDIKDLLS